MTKGTGLLITIVLGGLIYYSLFSTPGAVTSEQKPLVIEKGMTMNDIADLLKKTGYIKSTFGFEAFVWLNGLSGKLQAGDYNLPANLSLGQIVDYLKKGLGAVQEKELKIIEGWTTEEIGAYLETDGVTTKTNFISLVKDNNFKFKISDLKFLTDKPKSAGLEGYLFPDTYRVYKEATAEEIVQKMLQNFDSKLTAEMRAEIEKQGRSIFDVIRMASIVEAEVSRPEDRPLVAGVLWNRLGAGMLLQCDSTLNYVLDQKKNALTLADLKNESRYNTYKYPGLPPTPIGNPGLGAIKAAIYPNDSPYWYFLSTKDGQTIFSKTYDEHIAAKAKYLK